MVSRCVNTANVWKGVLAHSFRAAHFKAVGIDLTWHWWNFEDTHCKAQLLRLFLWD